MEWCVHGLTDYGAWDTARAFLEAYARDLDRMLTARLGLSPGAYTLNSDWDRIRQSSGKQHIAARLPTASL